jgi:hypothetical protein
MTKYGITIMLTINPKPKQGEYIMNYELSDFISRQTKPEFVGTKVTEEQLNTIVQYINDHPDGWRPGNRTGVIVWDVPLDLVSLKCPVAEITKDNMHMLVSKYKARRAGELPVLVRYFEGLEKVFPYSIEAVVYTREQLESEKEVCFGFKGDLIVVLANRYPGESLMDPNTVIRNALGAEFGGSGHPIDRGYYTKSVEFWDTHALVE